MTLGWKQAYTELEGYIAANSEIKISKGITVLPDNNREEFYRLFDNVRQAFLKEQTPDIYADACELSMNYLAEAGKLKETLNLTEIITPSQLNWLLSDPLKGLSRALLNPLFNLLKGIKTVEEFERDAEETVRVYWQPLFKSGYESWVILSITNLLSPRKVLAPSWDEIKHTCHELQPDEKRGWCEEYVPGPREVKKIEMGHEGYDPAFMVSDIILQSFSLMKYVSFGANLSDAAWTAKNASERRMWIKLRDRGLESRPLLNWPGLVIYTDDEPDEISIVSDFSRFLQPEIMVECMQREDWYLQGQLEKIKARHAFFKPTLGTFIVSRYPVPDEILSSLEPQTIPVSQAGVDAKREPGIPPVPGNAPAENLSEEASNTNKPSDASSTERHQNIFFVSAAGYNREALAPVIDMLMQTVKERDESGSNHQSDAV